MPDKTLATVPPSGLVPEPNIPEILESLIKAAPPVLQGKLRAALSKAAIINPADPVFELVLVLELVGIFYQRTAGTVVKAGADMDTRNTAALASLDERVRMLQGLAQIIQQATDQLDSAGREIAERFPADAVVAALLKKVDDKIRALPIKNLEEVLAKANGTMHTVANKAENSTNRIDTAVGRMEEAANRIEAVKLPRLSWWGSLGLVVLGMVLAFGGMWWFKTRSDVNRIAWVLNDHSYLEDRIWVGPGPDNSRVINIPKESIESAKTQENGNIVIQLKK